MSRSKKRLGKLGRITSYVGVGATVIALGTGLVATSADATIISHGVKYTINGASCVAANTVINVTVSDAVPAENYAFFDRSGKRVSSDFTATATGFTTDFTMNTVPTSADLEIDGPDVQNSAYTQIADACASVNHNPVANNDTATTNENNPVTVNVLANDTDQDKDALTVTGATTPTHGTTAVSGNGTTVTYTPSNGYYGTDTFTYTISDGHGGTASATVTIQVTANQPPPCTAPLVVHLGGHDVSADKKWVTVYYTITGCVGTLILHIHENLLTTPSAGSDPKHEMNYNFSLTKDSPTSQTVPLMDGIQGKCFEQVDYKVLDKHGKVLSKKGFFTPTANCPTSAQPANPTIQVGVADCAITGGTNGGVVLTVDNTADATKATVDYTYTISAAGITPIPGKILQVADGTAGTTQLKGLPAGTYTVSVAGSDGTTASTTFKVDTCSTPIPPPATTVTPVKLVVALPNCTYTYETVTPVKQAGVVWNLSGTTLKVNESVTYTAHPATGYVFPAGIKRSWTFTNTFNTTKCATTTTVTHTPVLPFTGSSVRTPTVLGGSLALAGLTLLLAGRRRRTEVQ